MMNYSLKNFTIIPKKINTAKLYDWDITFDKTFNVLIETYEKFKNKTVLVCGGTDHSVMLL